MEKDFLGKFQVIVSFLEKQQNKGYNSDRAGLPSLLLPPPILEYNEALLYVTEQYQTRILINSHFHSCPPLPPAFSFSLGE